MQLDKLLQATQNPATLEANFLYLERYVNDVKGKFTNLSDVDPRYSPENGMVEFEAPFARVKRNTLTILQDQPSTEVHNIIFEDETALFV